MDVDKERSLQTLQASEQQGLQVDRKLGLEAATETLEGREKAREWVECLQFRSRTGQEIRPGQPRATIQEQGAHHRGIGFGFGGVTGRSPAPLIVARGTAEPTCLALVIAPEPMGRVLRRAGESQEVGDGQGQFQQLATLGAWTASG